MSTNISSNQVRMEGRLELAIDAYNKGQFKNKKAGADAYAVSRFTLSRWLRGSGTRQTSQQNNRNMTDFEEATLAEWILDLSARGHPVRFSYIEHMANQLLSAHCGLDLKVGQHWVGRFIARNPRLKTGWYRKYDYERALCEDPNKIREWFDLVQNMIDKYGTPPSDIWNFDEPGFAMGILGSGIVITGVDSTSQQSSVQAGNREWTTAIEAINAEGVALPPMIIFQGKLHQEAWYNPEWFDPDWSIGLSESGWTTDALGLDWLQKVFDPHSNKYRQGTHRLLIMDNHGSHETPEFDAACKELNIIPICMPPHSSHLLQPLDVGLFSPLKRMYTKELENTFRLGINHIDKLEFLETYKRVRPQVFTKSNILGAFRGAGISPSDPTAVLDLLNAPLGPTTPENEPKQVQQQSSPWVPQTPLTIRQLDKQKQMLDTRLENRTHRLSSPTEQLLEQVVKACQTAMTGATVLATENQALRAVNEKQKRKRASKRTYIGEGGVVSGREAQERTKRVRMHDNEVRLRSSGRGEPSSTRAPPKCSICRSLEHTARSRPNRFQ